MKIKTDTESLLEIQSFAIGIALFAWGMGLFILVVLIHRFLQGSIEMEQTLSLLWAFFISFFGGAAFGKKDIFRVDQVGQAITWSRKGIWGQDGHQVPFKEITDVVVQKTSQGNSYSYRVAVKTADTVVPVSQIYSMGAKEKCEAIREKISQRISG